MNYYGKYLWNQKNLQVFKSKNVVLNLKFLPSFVEMIRPDVKLSEGWTLMGELDRVNNKVSFISKLNAFSFKNHSIEDLSFQIDNQNPLLQSQVAIGLYKQPKFQVADFHLLSKTINDTLYARTDFIGGKKSLKTHLMPHWL